MQIHPHHLQHEDETIAVFTHILKVIEEIHDVFRTFQVPLLFSIVNVLQCFKCVISMTFHIEFQRNRMSISAVTTSMHGGHLKSSDNQHVKRVPSPSSRIIL